MRICGDSHMGLSSGDPSEGVGYPSASRISKGKTAYRLSLFDGGGVVYGLGAERRAETLLSHYLMSTEVSEHTTILACPRENELSNHFDVV
jgi:hypothetical protein